MGMLIIRDEKKGGVMKKIIVMFGVLLLAAVMVRAVETLTDDGSAKAKIIQAATLEHQDGALDFGVLIADTDGGSSTLAAVAAPTAQDSGIKRAAGAVSSDHFVLSNLDADMAYTVAIPASATITKEGGSETMSVALTKSDASVTGVTSKDIYVGGTLTVGGNQAAGVYTGSYTMTVTY